MKLSFSTLGCPEWTLEQIARKAREYGYDGVELRVADDGVHLSPEAPPAEVERAAGLFRDAGVPVVSLCGYASFSAAAPEQVQSNQRLMRKLIAIAQALGARWIRAYGGKYAKDEDVAVVARRVAAAVRPVAEEAARHSVTIAIETHTHWAAGENLMRILEGTRGLPVGVLFDVNNTLCDTGEWRRTYDLIKAHVCYCHVKDEYRTPDGRGHHVMLGAGHLPLRDVLGQLKRDQFGGFLSLEWEKRWTPELEPPERIFPQYVYKMRTVWDEV
jgi:sugar phosphate isomerase/epimerase